MSMDPLELASSPELQRSARKLIRSQPHAKQSDRRAFIDVSNALFNAYLHLQEYPVEVMRALLPLIYDLTAKQWGADSILHTTLNLHARGIPANRLALQAMAAARRTNDFDLARDLMADLNELEPDDLVVSLFLAQSEAALGNFQRLEGLSFATRQSAVLSPWLIGEWTKLTLNNLLINEARRWLELSADEAAVMIADQRIASFESADPSFSIEANVISLDRDTRRWPLVERSLKLGGAVPIRRRAVDGMELPEYALEHLGASAEVAHIHGAGAIAVALSHIRILENFLSTSQERIFVVEDDAAPYFHFSYFDKILDETTSVDFLWVNERMSLQYTTTNPCDLTLCNPWQILSARNNKVLGIGADGYFVNREGATKLLENFSKDKVLGHIDGQIAAYSANVDDSPVVTRSQVAVKSLRAQLTDPRLLSDQALSIPMVWSNDHGSSNNIATSDLRRQSS